MKITILLSLLVAFYLPVSGAPAPIVSPDGPEILPASSPYGEAVVRKNLPYCDHATTNQNFDLYLPESKGSQPFPLLIWIHGGAWMTGLKDWNDVKFLVRHGYAIASIDYRGSGEAQFPAQIMDCNAALNFIWAHAAEYGVNSNLFIVGGSSAGGHLALLLGLARHEPGFGADPAIQPRAILDFYGPVEFNRAVEDLRQIHSTNGLALFYDVVPRLLGPPPAEFYSKATVASPITYVNASNPPVFIAQGGRDDMVPAMQSERLQRALAGVGVKNRLVLVESAGHGGPLFSSSEMEAKTVQFLEDSLTNFIAPAAMGRKKN